MACKFPVEPLKWVLGEDGKMNVQAFLNNVSFPKNLEELDYYKDEFDVERYM